MRQSEGLQRGEQTSSIFDFSSNSLRTCCIAVPSSLSWAMRPWPCPEHGVSLPEERFVSRRAPASTPSGPGWGRCPACSPLPPPDLSPSASKSLGLEFGRRRPVPVASSPHRFCSWTSFRKVSALHASS